MYTRGICRSQVAKEAGSGCFSWNHVAGRGPATALILRTPILKTPILASFEDTDAHVHGPMSCKSAQFSTFPARGPPMCNNLTFSWRLEKFGSLEVWEFGSLEIASLVPAAAVIPAPTVLFSEFGFLRPAR